MIMVMRHNSRMELWSIATWMTLRAYAVIAHELYVRELEVSMSGLRLGWTGIGVVADVCQRVEKRGIQV